jgi:hypothetical protein
LKQRRIPGIVNLFEVSDPSQIKALANNPIVDRFLDTRTCPINWFLLKRSLIVLSFKGRRFPTMEPRLCEKRARAQDALWRKLNDQVATVRAGPMGLEPLAELVKGVGSEEVGILAQQVLGRLFRKDFTATPESWAAALVLVAVSPFFESGEGVLVVYYGKGPPRQGRSREDGWRRSFCGERDRNRCSQPCEKSSPDAFAICRRRFKERALSRSGCKEVLTRTR